MRKFTAKPVLFMIVLSLIYTTALAGINAVAADRIRLNEHLSEQASFLYALGILPDNRDAALINELFTRHVRKIEVNGRVLYEALGDDGELAGYIIPMDGAAVWGRLRGVIALSSDFRTVLGIDFISHSETPGVGGRIDELSFREQFRGIKITPDGSGNFLIFRPHPGGQVDAISGATGTSNAVRRIFNDTMTLFMSETRERLTDD